MSGDTLVRERDETQRPPATAPQPGGLSIGRLVLGGLLIAFGVLWLVDAAGLTELRWRVVLPAALTVVGVGLLASAGRRNHGGLVGLGIVLTVLVVFAGMFPVSTPLVGVGDRTERPRAAAEMATGYELGMGTLLVDLRDVEVPRGGAELSASVGMGDLVVRLPEGVGAEVRARSGAGEIVLLGRSRGGVGVTLDERVPENPTLTLDLSVGLGKVEVRR
jgi:hypothetical protein